jgi:hypothetical protein
MARAGTVAANRDRPSLLRGNSCHKHTSEGIITPERHTLDAMDDGSLRNLISNMSISGQTQVQALKVNSIRELVSQEINNIPISHRRLTSDQGNLIDSPETSLKLGEKLVDVATHGKRI